MHPIARRDDHVARPLDGGLVILSPDRRVHHLDAVAAHVWSHADGSQSAAQLAEGLRAAGHDDATTTLVFEALDRLADAGLLTARAAPPAGVSRRTLLRRLTGGAALAALTAVVGLPEAALAKGASCGDEKDLIAEIAWLEAEASGVADVLEDWIDEAELAEEQAADAAALASVGKGDTGVDTGLDEVYLANLRKRERSFKVRRSKYAELRADATEDLADCKVAGKTVNVEERLKRREQHYAKRQEQNTKQLALRTERQGKRHKAYGAREHLGKARLSKRENSIKKKFAANPKKLEAKLAHNEVAAKSGLVRHKARLARQEKRTKATHAHSEQLQKSIAVRRESGLKRAKQRLIHATERAEIQAEALASRKLAQASTSKGVQDRVYEIAQEEALKAQALSHQEKKLKSAQEQKGKSAQEQSGKASYQPATPAQPASSAPADPTQG